MQKMLKGIAVVFIIFSGACSSEQEITVFSVSYVFGNTDEGWTGDFADYPENDSITYELSYKHDLLPENLNSSGALKALHVSGKNLNKDLFMFIKKKISGLRPNKTYSLIFNMKLASNTPTVSETSLIGESVHLKVGASVVEPKKELQSGVYRMNINKGNQAESGVDMITIGHIGVAATTTTYKIINRNNSSDFLVTTDDTGEIWLMVGTDSGYQGLTSLYYTQIDVFLNQVD